MELSKFFPNAEETKALAIANYVKNNQDFLQKIGELMREAASTGRAQVIVKGEHSILQTILIDQGYNCSQTTGRTCELRIELY